MAIFFENYGLDFLEEDNDVMGILGYAAQEGSAKIGYYGNPYIFKPMGDFEMWLKTEITENSLQLVGFDTHCRGYCLWRMRYSGIDITPRDASKLDKTLIFNCDDNHGLLPIELIGADVLPSFLKDDIIEMQVIALPLDINYYENEDEYAEAQPENEKGEKWLAAVGSMLPVSFLVNHNPSTYDKNKNYTNDSHVCFAATVKALYRGEFEVHDEKMNSFIRCVAETNFGPIEFNHSIEQVPEEMRDKIKVGAIISGVCVISGDVAIKEYNDGIVKNPDNNYKLVQYTLVNGDPDRLKYILTENAIYESECSGVGFAGKQRIIDRIKEIHADRDSDYSANLAKIVSIDGGEAEYPVGTKCIVLREQESTQIESIAFLSFDEHYNITKIKFSVDSRYHFELD